MTDAVTRIVAITALKIHRHRTHHHLVLDNLYVRPVCLLPLVLCCTYMYQSVPT